MDSACLLSMNMYIMMKLKDNIFHTKQVRMFRWLSELQLQITTMQNKHISVHNMGLKRNSDLFKNTTHNSFFTKQIFIVISNRTSCCHGYKYLKIPYLFLRSCRILYVTKENPPPTPN